MSGLAAEVEDDCYEQAEARDMAADIADEELAAERAKSQAFFHALALELRKPSYGVMQRDYASALLLRAQEAKLYVPQE